MPSAQEHLEAARRGLAAFEHIAEFVPLAAVTHAVIAAAAALADHPLTPATPGVESLLASDPSLIACPVCNGLGVVRDNPALLEEASPAPAARAPAAGGAAAKAQGKRRQGTDPK